MFKNIIYITALLLVFNIQLFCQKRVDGVLIDKTSKTPISFASLINIRTGTGIVSTDSGHFKLTLFDSDMIQISCIGYDSITLSAPDLSASDTIFLTRNEKQLAEVIIKKINWTVYKGRTVGSQYRKSNWHVGGKIAMEYATYIENNNNYQGYIWEVHYKLRKLNQDTVAIRLHVYSNDNGMPGVELLDSNYVKLIVGVVDGVVKYDISPMRISLSPSGVFIGIEWLGKHDPHGNAIINSSATYPSLGFNEKVHNGITVERESGMPWILADIRKYYLNTETERKAYSNDPPHASIGILIRYLR